MMLERQTIVLCDGESTALNAGANKVITTGWFDLERLAQADVFFCARSGGATALLASVALEVRADDHTSSVTISGTAQDAQTWLSTNFDQLVLDATKGRMGSILPFKADPATVERIANSTIFRQARLILTRDATAVTLLPQLVLDCWRHAVNNGRAFTDLTAKASVA